MAKRVQDLKPARKADAKAWMKENVAEQKKRYAAIVKEQDELGPEREKWVAGFLQVIQTRGFNVTGDTRRIIKPGEIPKKPKGMKKHQVVF
ncbi:hypothetical protein GPROT2_03282 [Gammaproteobacteria bacterium]|nr:hypothetical protein [Gammaproteobacteria bacterium]QOJ32151.1 MAG: hypothetical protein HRU81_08605 [Gammaproteobacteria bacterium]CAG0945571.1 hypothetical protein GPROT2_03282 [Gammaproteobacteria bacterium]